MTSTLICLAVLTSSPNVLFISVDDLNDWASPWGGHPQVQTPNAERLADSGAVVFQNAHGAAAVCNPSRAALLSGFLPSTTGVYGNRQNMRNAPLVQTHATLPEWFARHGYRTVSRGKIFHRFGSGDASDAGQWAFTDWSRTTGSLRPLRSRLTSSTKGLIGGEPIAVEIDGRPWGSEFAWGPSRVDTPDSLDWQTAEWAAGQLSKRHDRPLFLAVGLSRPHLPFVVPQEFFDRYDAETFEPPTVRDDDLDDIVTPDGKPFLSPTHDYRWVRANDQFAEAAVAYAAACTYADACIGRMIDALESGPNADDTIVVVWGDHGWHLGEKLRYRKATGWHEATRVPLLIRMPDATMRQDCHRAVSLLDLYPTLIELCRLADKPTIEGRSLAPLLKRPDDDWPHPAVSVVRRGHVSVHGDRYHYIRHPNGAEELYDLESDPMEFGNLAGSPSAAERAARDRLAAAVPKNFAEPVSEESLDRERLPVDELQ